MLLFCLKLVRQEKVIDRQFNAMPYFYDYMAKHKWTSTSLVSDKWYLQPYRTEHLAVDNE